MCLSLHTLKATFESDVPIADLMRETKVVTRVLSHRIAGVSKTKPKQIPDRFVD